jgi:hypothetical protein
MDAQLCLLVSAWRVVIENAEQTAECIVCNGLLNIGPEMQFSF